MDGDTGQVRPEISELLALPLASGSRELGLRAEDLSVAQARDDGLVEAAGRPAGPVEHSEAAD